ncbi:hypothetical protein ACPOL_0158 [Acidisarcina polymorpha]|uniref:Uncharacterized protein n=1 Tax=Acidisarcina polymorpha TaxID=2211140 RepID=A0A2Z5FS34_9BACT|nr:hypothetical protein ACPOL_0158 [Acidisarcina polymorpha]
MAMLVIGSADAVGSYRSPSSGRISDHPDSAPAGVKRIAVSALTEQPPTKKKSKEILCIS